MNGGVASACRFSFLVLVWPPFPQLFSQLASWLVSGCCWRFRLRRFDLGSAALAFVLFPRCTIRFCSYLAFGRPGLLVWFRPRVLALAAACGGFALPWCGCVLVLLPGSVGRVLRYCSLHRRCFAFFCVAAVLLRFVFRITWFWRWPSRALVRPFILAFALALWSLFLYIKSLRLVARCFSLWLWCLA